MKHSILTLSLLIAIACSVDGHDVITTAITWDREISRIVYDRCASCHHEGGKAFSLMTYAEARPWAVAIKEEVLSRHMPPWGAIKGFGDFRNDQSLTSEQLELITSWVEGGEPEGDPKDLLPPPKLDPAPSSDRTEGGLTINGDFQLQRRFELDGLMVRNARENESFQIVAEFPDGVTEPLLWIYEYRPAYKHPFLFRTPIELPARTIVRGVPAGSSIVLLPK